MNPSNATMASTEYAEASTPPRENGLPAPSNSPRWPRGHAELNGADSTALRTRGWMALLVRAVDALLSPLTTCAALWLKTVRRAGVDRMPLARALFRRIGVFPIRDHYYEPLFHPRHLRRPLSDVRELPGLDLDVRGQLALLAQFRYQDELSAFPIGPTRERQFYYNNRAFESGDAEYLYSLIRHFRPRRIIEIGSGYSTLIAAAAIRRNRADDERVACDQLCIEPYEAPWLERVGVRVLRRRVESLDPDLFLKLERNDILFIDSSHVIRPQGDVLFEYLHILPRLRSGVLVHIHDIYTPRDVPEEWIHERVRFWNEQYLLEAFLSCNREFRVIAALNHLKHEHFEALADKCPVLKLQPRREPGSFWLVRV